MDHLVSDSPIRKHRRRFSAEFKAMVIDASNAPDQSVASVAQQYELNANLLHKWRREHDVNNPIDFIQLPVPAKSIDSRHTVQPETVQIDLPGGVIVHWPMDHIDHSVSWLKAIMP